MAVRKEHFSLRLNPDTIERLARQAEQSGLPKTVLAERFLEEGLVTARHPMIVFRDGPAGRRPGLAGRGLDVWEIVETVHNEGGDVRAAADYLSLGPAVIEAVLDYYAEFKDDVGRWIERNAALAKEAEATWRRRQAALQT